MKASLEKRVTLKGDVQDIRRVCSSTIKHSCDVLLLLKQLESDCKLHSIRHFNTGEAIVVLLGKWGTALLALEQKTGGNDLERRLLRLRVSWLDRVGNHPGRLWLTAHARIAVWLRCHCQETATPRNVYPRPDLCTSTNMLPDPRKYLLQLPLFQASVVKSDIGRGKCKLTHLLNKCLPKRCQIRELTRFLSEYCLKDQIFRSCFERMMYCSLCGIYSHCGGTPPFGIVISLCATLLYQSGTNTGLTAWIKSSHKIERNKNQLVCLHIVREYLCACVATQPTLRATLCKHFNWITFEEETFEVMTHVRAVLYTHCQRDNFYLSGVHIMHAFTSKLYKTPELVSTRTTNFHNALQLVDILHVFSKLRNKQLSLLSVSTWRNLEALCREVVNKSASCTTVGLMCRLQQVCTDENSFEFIRCIIRCLHCNTTESAARKDMEALLNRDIFHYTLLEHELRDVSQQLFTRVHTLPLAIRDAQRAAVTRELSYVPHVIAPHSHSNLLYCTSCNKVANSCITNNRKNKSTRSHLMSIKTVIDDDKGVLLCAQHAKYTSTHATNSRTITFENCLAGIKCRQQQLLIVPICGKLVQVKNELYSLCVSCGHVIKVETGMQLKCKVCKGTHINDLSLKNCFMCTKSCVHHQSVLCFSIKSASFFEETILCNTCILHLCKKTRSQIVTRTQMSQIYAKLTHCRLLAIPGEKYNFFQKRNTT